MTTTELGYQRLLMHTFVRNINKLHLCSMFTAVNTLELINKSIDKELARMQVQLIYDLEQSMFCNK